MIVMRLKAIAPAWKQALSNDDDWAGYRREIVIALFENGITSLESVERGLKKARANCSPFLPSPGEFVQWCRPTAADFGLPEPDQAYVEAANHRWGDHPIVYLAAKSLGVYEVATKPEGQMRPRFVKVYQVLLDRVLAGETFTDNRGSLRGIDQHMERLEVKPVTPEQSNMARIQALSILGVARP